MVDVKDCDGCRYGDGQEQVSREKMLLYVLLGIHDIPLLPLFKDHGLSNDGMVLTKSTVALAADAAIAPGCSAINFIVP